MKKIKVTEYLNIDLETEMWTCDRCDAALVSAKKPYMHGCLVHDRPATGIYGAPVGVGDGQVVSYAPDPNFNRILEFCCPHCGTMLEVQYLPPGHPIPVDISLDIEKLKSKHAKERL
jgi:acetone carboxylase gamma subunit